MPITEDRIAKLREFGLSEYAARAYLALLDLGLTEARDISTLSKVPTSKIYHILEQLHERGLCIILPEFPKKYAPVPFSDYLDKLQTQHEEAARAIDRDRGRLADMFAVAGDVDVGDRGTFTVLRGRRNVLSKIVELVGGTSREMFILGTRGTLERMEYYEEDLRAAVDRGVRARFAVPMSEDALPILEGMDEYSEIRERVIGADDQGANVAIAIFDNERALIVNFLPDDGHLYQGKDTAFFTDHEAMVAALRSVVEPHWAAAASLETRRSEIREGRVREFTRVYATEAEAREHLHASLAQGVSEVVAMRGTSVTRVSEDARHMLDDMVTSGAHVRAVVQAQTEEAFRAVHDLFSRHDGAECRHVDELPPTRFWVLDEREAFFSLAHASGTPGDAGSELLVHTSNAATVRSLRAHFESAWSMGRPLEMREKELADGGEEPLPRTRFLPATEDAVEASRAVTARARTVVQYMVGAQGLERLGELPVVKACVERGVTLRVLASVTKQTADAARRVQEFAEVRHVSRVSLLGNSADGEEAFIVLPRANNAPADDDGGSWTENASVVVHSVDPVYVRAFDGFFEAQWPSAVPLADRLAELGLEPPAKTTRNVPVS